MASECGDLEIDGLGDVDHDGRVFARHHADGVNHVGLGPWARSSRNTRWALARDTMESLASFGTLKQNEIRPISSDGRGDGETGLSSVFDLTVRESEKLHSLDTQDPRRLGAAPPDVWSRVVRGSSPDLPIPFLRWSRRNRRREAGPREGGHRPARVSSASSGWATITRARQKGVTSRPVIDAVSRPDEATRCSGSCPGTRR